MGLHLTGRFWEIAAGLDGEMAGLGMRSSHYRESTADSLHVAASPVMSPQRMLPLRDGSTLAGVGSPCFLFLDQCFNAP
jgi:hypothetical protein